MDKEKLQKVIMSLENMVLELGQAVNLLKEVLEDE